MKVFLVAGEVSGDRLGGALMAGLKTLAIDSIDFLGVGGVSMAEGGLKSQFPMDELSLMGLVEILPKYRHLKRRIREVSESILQIKPDVVITIDSPDFCLRVARMVKAARPEQKIVHYVAPTVWAWRPGRAAKMAKVVDHVLALFPFEPPYMTEVGLSCDFVGHPVVSETPATSAEAQAFRNRIGIGSDPMVLVLPGSRRGEVARLTERFGQAASLFHQKQPAHFVIPCATPVEGLVRRLTQSWPVSPLIVPAEAVADKRAAFAAADMALAASGTVSLELAANTTPMVIGYDMNWMSRLLIARMLKVDTVTLVNLVSERRVVPEFIGRDCEPDALARALLETFHNPQAQCEAMAETMHRLGLGLEAPGLRAARSVLGFMAARSSH